MSEFDTVTVQDAEGITAISLKLNEVKPGFDCIKLIAPRMVCQMEDLFLSKPISA